MRYFFLLLICFSCTCTIRPGYYSTSTYTTPLSVNPSYNYWNPVPTRSYFWYPNTRSLGNVYNNNYYITKQPKIRTNLPLNNGPRGGRRN